MALSCRVCGAPFQAADLDHERQLARCAHCDTLADLQETTRSRPAVPLPERFTVDQDHRRLEIHWAWRNPIHVFLAFFSLAWNGFLVVWFSMSLLAGPLAILLWLFASVHVLVGVGLGWWAIAGLFNTTTLTVDAMHLRVHHGPIPWPGNLELRTAELDQLYAKQKTTKTKNGVSVSYELRAIVRGKDRLVVRGLTEDLQALWLEQELEGRLGLIDAPVIGELDPEQP